MMPYDVLPTAQDGWARVVHAADRSTGKTRYLQHAMMEIVAYRSTHFDDIYLC